MKAINHALALSVELTDHRTFERLQDSFDCHTRADATSEAIVDSIFFEADWLEDDLLMEIFEYENTDIETVRDFSGYRFVCFWK